MIDHADTVTRPKVRATIATLLTAAMALGLFLMRSFGSEAAVQRAEWRIGALALASIYAMPAVVGMLARRRPHLNTTAGVLCMVLSVSLMSVITLPLIVPGILFLTAGSAERASRAAVLTVVLIAVAAVSVALVLFGPSTTVCWREIEYADGRTEVMRDRAAETASSDGTFSQTLGPEPGGAVSTSGGCSGGTIAPVTSLAILAAVSTGLVATWRFS